MGIDDGRVGQVDAGQAATFLGLMEDHIDRSDQCVCEMQGRDILRQSPEILEKRDYRDESIEKRLHMSVDDPSHTRPPTFALLVHEPNELGMPSYEMNVRANAGPDRVEGIFALVDAARREHRDLECVSDLCEGSIYRGLPEFEFFAEVVSKQAEWNVRSTRDLPRGRAVEAVLGKGL